MDYYKESATTQIRDRDARRSSRRAQLDSLVDFRHQSKATRTLNENMLDWINSFTMGNVKPKQFLCEIADFTGDLRGMRATTNIKAGQKILWMPMDRMVIHANIVLEDSVVKRFLNATHPADLEFTMEDLFFIFLIAHKRKRHISRYATYINSLPNSYDTPIMWDDHQIKTMSPDDSQIVFDEIDKVWEIFAVIKESLENTCILNDLDFYTDFLWAYNVVKTRGFECRLDGRHKFQLMKIATQYLDKFNLSHVSINHILCPYMDMINHSYTGANADVEKDIMADCWTCFATRDIRIGEQIFISYGEDSTANTFITYGFIDGSKANPYEKVCFTAEDISEKEQVKNMITSSGLYNPADPKENSLYLSNTIGCSWGMQRAVILTVINSPAEIGLTENDFTSENCNYLSCSLKLTEDITERANEALRKVVRKKVLQLRDAKKNLEENVIFQRGNEMVKMLFDVQIGFLTEYLDRNQYLFLLRATVEEEDFRPADKDSGNDTS